MSCNYHVYIGPYVKTITSLIESYTPVRLCGKKGCSQKNIAVDNCVMFCFKCGSTIETSFKTTTKFKITTNVAWEEVESFLFPMPSAYAQDDVEQIWFTSSGRKGLNRTLIFDTDDELELENPDVSGETEWFVSTHEESINKLKSIYGAENVITGWGIFSYWT